MAAPHSPLLECDIINTLSSAWVVRALALLSACASTRSLLRTCCHHPFSSVSGVPIPWFLRAQLHFLCILPSCRVLLPSPGCPISAACPVPALPRPQGGFWDLCLTSCSSVLRVGAPLGLDLPNTWPPLVASTPGPPRQVKATGGRPQAVTAALLSALPAIHTPCILSFLSSFSHLAVDGGRREEY